MPAGVPTDEEKVAEFRAHYLLSGNAAKSARAVGLPERTGRHIASKLLDDPSFADDGRKLRAEFLSELVQYRMRTARIAFKRFRDGSEEVSERGGNVTIIDKRPEYARVVLEAEKLAQNLARFETEQAAPVDTERTVRITIMGPDQ